MRQEIKVSTAERQRLATLYKVTPQSVGLALRFKRDSLKARQIREDALQNGGQLEEIRVIETHKRNIRVLNAKGEVIKTI